MKTLWLTMAKQRDDIARFTAAAIKNAEAVENEVRAASVVRRPAAAVSALPVSFGNLADVVNASTCEQLVAQYFPDDTAWALRIAQRESHCTAGAINNEGCDTSGRTNSHALGVFQMCVPMHEPTFAAVGCSGRYLDLECNIKAARQLYLGSGRSPWGG